MFYHPQADQGFSVNSTGDINDIREMLTAWIISVGNLTSGIHCSILHPYEAVKFQFSFPSIIQPWKIESSKYQAIYRLGKSLLGHLLCHHLPEKNHCSFNQKTWNMVQALQISSAGSYQRQSSSDVCGISSLEFCLSCLSLLPNILWQSLGIS